MSRTMFFRYAGLVMLPFITIAALTHLYFHDPNVPGTYPDCLFYKLSGLYCPGCGITRSTYSILHLQILHAFDLNPLAVLIMPVIGFDLTLWWAKQFREINYRSLLGRIPVKYVLSLFLLYWIFRNLPYYPFSLMAP